MEASLEDPGLPWGGVWVLSKAVPQGLSKRMKRELQELTAETGCVTVGVRVTR